MALISHQELILKTFKKYSEIFLHSSLAYIFSLTWLRCWKINIDVICITIKVINLVKTNIMSTESMKYVKRTRQWKHDSLLSEQRCASCFWSFDDFEGLCDLIIESQFRYKIISNQNHGLLLRFYWVNS